MPYIKVDDGRREALRNGEPALTAGELNYQIFYYVKHNYSIENYFKLPLLIKKYVNQFLGEKPNYQRYNDITGVLICCKNEIYRRLEIDLETLIQKILNSYDDEIAKYEDLKISENGDVE